MSGENNEQITRAKEFASKGVENCHTSPEI